MHLLVSYCVQSTALDIVGIPKMNETSSLLEGSYIQGARHRVNKELLVDIGGGRGKGKITLKWFNQCTMAL